MLELRFLPLRHGNAGVIGVLLFSKMISRRAWGFICLCILNFPLLGLAAPENDPLLANNPQRDASKGVTADDVLKMSKFEVTAKPDVQLNAIDRKVYNVGKEIQSAAGSASDLLQNVPSVDVDIDGNISLRGSDNVLILIDGRSSALMGKNRAEILAQFPADSIDRIEVITNPSAKYKPDGTAGIINIVLKQKHTAGTSGTVTFNVGNEDRYNSSVSLNYHPGALNFFGNLSVRQDDRPRTAADIRTITDAVTGAKIHAEKYTVEESRPLSEIVRLGFDTSANPNNQFGMVANYNHRTAERRAVDHNRVTDSVGNVTSEYDRVRFDPESERSIEGSATFLHRFSAPGHELNLEYKASNKRDLEPDHYTNLYRSPAQGPTFDNVIIRDIEDSREAIIGYVRPLADNSTLEAGYDYSDESRDSDIFNESFDPVSARWVGDPAKSNRFILDRTIHAFYATYTHSFGNFALLAGVRPEFERVSSKLVTLGQVVPNNSAKVFPSLHLTYRLDDRQELQWNYSHRVHRPDSDDLNPFPEYLDPFTLRTGNPRLLPEDIHSIETGYGYREDATSFTATAYYRYTYHGFTNFTSDLGNGVLLTTHENLAVNRATGVEFTANRDLGKTITLTASTNTFFNTIDASNLGFVASKSTVSWIAKAGVTTRLGASTQLQLNGNYASARVTPQGERRPSYVANIGVRREFLNKKAALVLTVSDVFNTLKQEMTVNTPLLVETTTRKRSARIIYLGLSYNFGGPNKKSKEDTLKFDESL
ncbi:MAG: hypothetical protein JWM32_250 [Verrucomicrobia bacterium]|nr:hypothetical protein [Verrucomicrobiota bacterium]